MWKLNNEADTWFKDLESATNTKFEIYYFCLLAGVKSRTLGEQPDGEGFLNSFPSAFSNQRYQILGLLLEAELSRMEVDYSNEVDVQAQISRLLDSEAPSRLSPEGFDAANRYSSAGYYLIREKLGAPPRDRTAFLTRVHKLGLFS